MKLLIGQPGKQVHPINWIPESLPSYPENIVELFQDNGNGSKIEAKTLLYNLTNDPNEETNLADRYPDIVKDLKDRLSKYIKSMITSDSTNEILAAHPKYNDWIWPTGWCQSRPEYNTTTTTTAKSSTTVPTNFTTLTTLPTLTTPTTNTWAEQK